MLVRIRVDWRRAQLEDEAESDNLKQLEDEVKKLPAAKNPKRPKP
jgi:hypothetical protein